MHFVKQHISLSYCAQAWLVCFSLCSSRTKNMMWYGVLGTKELVQKTYKNLEQRVQLEVKSRRTWTHTQRFSLGKQMSVSWFLQTCWVFLVLKRLLSSVHSVTGFPCLCRVCRAWLSSTSPAMQAVSTSGEAPKRTMWVLSNRAFRSILSKKKRQENKSEFLLYISNSSKFESDGVWFYHVHLQNFGAPSFDDKKLEVVAVFGSMQMAVSRVINLQHHRIAQVTQTHRTLTSTCLTEPF